MLSQYFVSAGTGPVYDALERLGGAVFALAHYGSWDVAAACALRLQIPITTVMTTVGESDLATRVAGWARRQQDMEVLMTRGAAIGLLRAVRSGRCDAILCDIPDRGQRTTVNFCGGMVAFSTAPAWIARTAGVPLLPVHCWREDGGYILKVYAPVRVGGEVSDAEAMQAVADVLAIQVRRMPEQWYPFGEVFKD
ncbi:MAG: lysophospholipid acyltransferase family protein [Candidatus Dormibacteraeota bacterium]|nr:lysophospholipid acyltransferase family protein [Candidatus Dormibacteraeota bacterium]